MKTLDSCKHCGSKEIAYAYDHDSVRAQCLQCKIRTRNYSKGTKEQKEDYAADAWNRSPEGVRE